jgi:DNA-directed RNA polymerase specialized sigma24 family protein
MLEQRDAAAQRLAPLVRAAAAGDARAFGRLVAETQGVVCAITLAVTRDATASEDVAQQVYFDAWRGIGKLREATSFLPWLRGGARKHAPQAGGGAARGCARSRVTTHAWRCAPPAGFALA